MLITILPKEINIESWKLDQIKNITIDFTTNSLFGEFDNKEVHLFQFDEYGWFNENNNNTFQFSCGLFGIFIRIT